jgi:molybdopterin/thiamine biosynthesis adenylyltransferase
LVINALDNEEARKHVNNMCFNLNIPLVDSGTNGYAAQVSFLSFKNYSVSRFARARLSATNVWIGPRIRASQCAPSGRSQRS